MNEKPDIPLSDRGTPRPTGASWLPALATPVETAGPDARDWIAGEPSLEDVLSDPLVHAVLSRDSLDLQDLQRAIARGRERLATIVPHQAADHTA